MEANKVKGESKSLVLNNGAELTYCERGEQNKEIIITTAFYFHTVMPVVEGLAEKYHVYGIVMRFDGPADELNTDGSIHWGRQWGKDVYDFTQKMGIKKYIHVGKCHGTIPGWYMVKEHPEMLDCFASFYLAPHIKEQNSEKWFSMLMGNDTTAMMRAALRKPEERLKAKMDEMASIGDSVSSPAISEYAACAEKIWPSLEECDKTLKNMSVPVGYMFGSIDPLFDDYFDSNIYAMRNTRGARSVILEGECHLMELDCPDRVVSEVFAFIDESKKPYLKEIIK